MEYMKLLPWGILGILLHAMITIGRINKKTPTTVPISDILRAYIRVDWTLIVCSMLMIPALLLFREWYVGLLPNYGGPTWFLDGQPFLRSDPRLGLFFTSYFSDSLIMLLSATEGYLNNKIQKETNQGQ